MDPQLDALLKEYPVFDEGEFCKLHCKITGHDVPSRAAALQEYIKTKKFRTAFEVHQILEANPNIFEELDEGLLGCKITKTVVAKDPKDLAAHLKGKKFRKALERGVTGDEEEEEDVEMDEGDSDAEVGSGSEMEGSDEELDEESEDEEEEEEEEPEPVKPVKKGKKGDKAANGKQTPVTAKKPAAGKKAVGDDAYDFNDAVEISEMKISAVKGRKRANEEPIEIKKKKNKQN